MSNIVIVICHFRTVYEDDDQLLWTPDVLSESKVRDFLCEELSRATDERTRSDTAGAHVRDNEQVSHHFKTHWMS